MNTVILLIGGNIGDKVQNLELSKRLIIQNIGEVTKKSSIYETEAWGVENQPSFLNQVVCCETQFTPAQTLAIALQIETQMGRKRDQKWHERIIDIDILFFNELIVDQPNLKIPHPFIHQRNFTLVPLKEICPDLIHPLFNKSISQLLIESQDQLEVRFFR